MNRQNPVKHHLIAIAISHYCEKVRWGLDWLGIEYTEENHAPPLHRSHTAKYGGTTVPVLVTKNQALINSTAILHYLDTISPKKQLYPHQLRQEIEQLEELCDRQLGVAIRCWSYYYALQQPKLVLRAWCKGVSPEEKQQCAIAFERTVEIFKQNCNATAAGKEAALQTIKEVFEVVNDKLRSGTKYLVGDSLSAADISFAALASPILRPENHPYYSPKIDNLSSEMKSTIKDLRNTLAGKFALQLYKQKRLVNK